MKLNTGLSAKNTQAVASRLGKLLADEFVVFTKTKKAHWNVEGGDFQPMHEYFEKLFRELDTFIDTVAERIRSIGHFPPASLKEMLDLTRLNEKHEGGTTSKDFIRTLLADHENIITSIRKNIDECSNTYKDEGTTGMLSELLEKHEKMVWMLSAHLS